MSLYDAKMPSLKDKLSDQVKALADEAKVVEIELTATKKSKKRASKD